MVYIMKNDPDMLNALEKLESLSPETEAAACIAAARRFATMKRVVFDSVIAEHMAEADNDGERLALEEIGRRGPRALARQFLEEAETWGPGGGLRLALASTIRDLKKRLH